MNALAVDISGSTPLGTTTVLGVANRAVMKHMNGKFKLPAKAKAEASE